MDSGGGTSLDPEASAQRPPKRVVFDRRYGWIVDDWRSPSEEALAGSRGMFCLLPIAKTVTLVTTQSIDYTARAVIEIMENPDKLPSFSPGAMKANIYDQIQNIHQSIKKSDFKSIISRSKRVDHNSCI
ncbi:hypothetical protein ZOSMA_10G01160 [Zostera marina]|uniref:Uncharacterized protein n=1 Tax=Zostera marina TaxID=29655 RepID=A0A0K9Q5N3_ZOSMR|nr:hypothetical protein ZOSMA_10G01160 [Zostera marina]